MQEVRLDAGFGFHKKSRERGVCLRDGMNVASTAHQDDTARFGTAPATSVLDVNCREHAIDNLCLVDSSFSVSIGAVSPTLTIANSLRVGDHLLERLHQRVGYSRSSSQMSAPGTPTYAASAASGMKLEAGPCMAASACPKRGSRHCRTRRPTFSKPRRYSPWRCP